ncbi:MAG: serine/threonine protein kinase [Methylotenera sp.]|nr:MAG: serine/threonine protein kinase [Methylotenera sp.]
MKQRFWKSDWFAGLIISLAFLFAAGSDFLQSLERKAYDLGVQASARDPGDKIAVIAIDDQSIANIGRWPWSREVHANMIQKLSAGQAKVIGNTVYFLEPQIDAGLSYINKISTFLSSSTIATVAPEAAQLDAMLKEAQSALNTDEKLAASIKQANNVVLAMPFTIGEPRGNPDKPLPEYVAKNALPNIVDRINADENGLLPIPTISALSPIPVIGEAASAIGHLNANPDVDGAIRAEPLVLAFYDRMYPSLSLQVAAKYLNLAPVDVEVRLGEGVKLGRLNIATDTWLQMNTFFYSGKDGQPAFPVDSFFDVYSGKIPVEKYKGKIVLIGMAATGDGSDNQITPISSSMKPIETLAHSVASILNEDFFISPSWSLWAQLGVWLIIALYLILLLPRLKAGTAAFATLGLLTVLVVTHFVLMTQQGMWLQLMMPATLLLVGHGLLTTKRFLMTEQGKAKSDSDSAESNRNLALMFQSQGQLDMAFDRFRKCPMDDGVMEGLYNLGLDFERKRQFNKAESVFAYMANYNPKYKDLEQRISRSKAMAETVILGGSGAGRTNASTMILNDGSVEKPMLGRYQVEKELGKGAMGVVYLGRDPKISRVVAIKTMALSQEFEADELAEVKERFFREAETAGRLNHPNIVTIYDAGEEHDLAYISMEFLKGQDLAPHTKIDNLLPIPKVMEIVAKVADALDYAHAQNVVHRDIKPANIMYEADIGSVKVTDFGIARITDSSRTKTGMVLGTPSYMSPEQLAGKKVDGRSDLFSLGVMLYQMTTGHLPFTGDSMATLMFKIANEPHVSASSLNSAIPTCLATIIDRMLEKDSEKRYARGLEIAADLRQCAAAQST